MIPRGFYVLYCWSKQTPSMYVKISVFCISVLCEQKIHVHVSIKNKHKMTARSCMRANAIIQAFFFLTFNYILFIQTPDNPINRPRHIWYRLIIFITPFLIILDGVLNPGVLQYAVFEP